MDKLRKEIDKIDEEILTLMEKRQKLAKKIGLHKKKHGIPLRDIARETIILAGYAKRAVSLGLSAIAVSKIFKELISESRKMQEEVMDEKKPSAKKKKPAKK